MWDLKKQVGLIVVEYNCGFLKVSGWMKRDDTDKGNTFLIIILISSGGLMYNMVTNNVIYTWNLLRALNK